MTTPERPNRKPPVNFYFYGAILCWIAAAACLAAWLGACDGLVDNVTPSEDDGAVPLIFAIIFGGAGALAWRVRRGPIR